jgi:hypothetical protein
MKLFIILLAIAALAALLGLNAKGIYDAIPTGNYSQSNKEDYLRYRISADNQGDRSDRSREGRSRIGRDGF